MPGDANRTERGPSKLDWTFDSFFCVLSPINICEMEMEMCSLVD